MALSPRSREASMPMPTVVVLSVLLSSPAHAGDSCLVQATQWLQDGPLRAAADGPVLALATASPELLAVELELGSDPPVARVHLEDSVATVDTWMSFPELRVRAKRPLSFADDTIYTGKADLRVMEVGATGIKVSPAQLPSWIELGASTGATVACGDLDLVETWPGDLRPLAVGSAARGDRVYLRAGEHIEVSRIPGSSPAVTLHPDRWVPVEAVSKDAESVRVVVRFDGGIVVGWVPRGAVADEAGEGGEDEGGEEEAPAPAAQVEGTVLVCKKGAPLWVTAGGQDHILGTLAPGVGVVLGEKAEDRVPVLAVPSATAWAPAPDAAWWLDAKAARGCK
jgi:hypothetical protein